jgi:hypothetical protein
MHSHAVSAFHVQGCIRTAFYSYYPHFGDYGAVPWHPLCPNADITYVTFPATLSHGLPSLHYTRAPEDIAYLAYILTAMTQEEDCILTIAGRRSGHHLGL